MRTLAELKDELSQRQDDLNTCNEMLALDPSSADALETIPILEADISETKAKIAAKKAEQDAAPPPPPPNDDAAPPPPKYDMSKHPKFRKASPEAPPPPPEETQTQTIFNVKDVVMAKWSGDKQWYQATVVTKTGSTTDPIYKVTFKGYSDTETKRKHEIRAIVENKKRKADGSAAAGAAAAVSTPQTQTQTPASPNPTTAQQNGGTVISAAPSVDPTLVKKREPSKVSDGPTREPPAPKKLKGNKVLEKGKNSWQEFSKSGPKKTVFGAPKLGKESQFRTPDLPNARGEYMNFEVLMSCAKDMADLMKFVVGFTGSGQPMKKDQSRKTWKYGGGGGGGGGGSED